MNKRDATSLVKEPHVYRRVKDKEAMLELLMSGETGESQFFVIPIIGIGAVGKTACSTLQRQESEV